MPDDRPRFFVFPTLLVTVLLLGAVDAHLARAQPDVEIGFSQITRPVVTIDDPEAIQFLLNELIIIPEQEETTQVDVIDITGNGYGPDDVLVVYPSQESFKLNPQNVTGKVEEWMGRWEPEADFQFDSANLPPETFNPETDTTAQGQKAERAIMYDVLQTLERNYEATPINLRLEREAGGFTMQMWGYRTGAMGYAPAPEPSVSDTVTTRDLLQVVRSDSVRYDVLYLDRTVKETVYVPEGAPDRPAESSRSSSSSASRSEEQ